MDKNREIINDLHYRHLVGGEDPSVVVRGRISKLRTTIKMCKRSGGVSLIVTSEGTRTPLGLCLLAAYLAFTGRKILFLVEFLPGRRGGLKGRLVTLLYKIFLHRACAGVQVMTSWEAEAYTRWYGLDPVSVRHIPFYWFDERIPAADRDNSLEDRIMASGRNSTDWETIVAAARRIEAPVDLVCSAAELSYVESLRVSDNVRILSDIPRDVHDEMVRNSAIYLLALKDVPVSAGHVRLMTNATLATPVIATDVDCIHGYGHLAIELVAPRDSGALANAVNRALADRDQTARRESEVRRLAMSRKFEDYVSELQDFIEECSLKNQ
jgi:glycosyltransferase involved in cell wall biosynthesis